MPEDKSTEMRNKISNALNEPGLGDEHQRISSDELTRLARKFSPRVMTLKLGENEHLNPMAAPLPGTVTLYTAKKGSPLLHKLETALASRSQSSLNEIAAELSAVVEKRKIISIREFVDQLIEAPTYFEIRYGGKTLAQNVGLVGDLEFGSLTFAYNGGQLRDEDFQIVEYYKPGVQEDLEHLVVKNPPRLSELEQSVLRAVPEDMLESNIVVVGKCRGWTFAAAAAYVILTALGQVCLTRDSLLAQVSLTPEQVERLGNLGSARELLSMRRKILEQGA
jgi:hypothetical protein